MNVVAYFCIFHQIAFRQGAAILDAIRQGRPFCMAQQKMYSPQKWVHSIVMLGAKLRSTCLSKRLHLCDVRNSVSYRNTTCLKFGQQVTCNFFTVISTVPYAFTCVLVGNSARLQGSLQFQREKSGQTSAVKLIICHSLQRNQFLDACTKKQCLIKLFLHRDIKFNVRYSVIIYFQYNCFCIHFFSPICFDTIEEAHMTKCGHSFW